MTRLEKRQERLGWFFLAPTAAVILLVGLYPLAQTVYASFTDARLGSVTRPGFVGVENYVRLFQDGDFWASVIHTLIFTVTSVGLELVLGMWIALIINRKFRGRGLVRAAVLIPWALPTVISAKMWNYMFVDTFGVVNDLLVTRLGIFDEKIAWLARPGLALGCVIAVDVWKTTPFMALLLLAGLQTIPKNLYESARVDGASRWRTFTKITLPLLKPIILVALVFRTLAALRVFGAVWVMTRGQSGTETMATYAYRHMIDFRKLGYGSAASVTIFAIIAVFIAIYLRVFRMQREVD